MNLEVGILVIPALHGAYRVETLILQKLRFVIACPFLLAGIGFVLLGRVLLTKDDRLEFDKHYFGTPKKRP